MTGVEWLGLGVIVFANAVYVAAACVSCYRASSRAWLVREQMRMENQETTS